MYVTLMKSFKSGLCVSDYFMKRRNLRNINFYLRLALYFVFSSFA